MMSYPHEPGAKVPGTSQEAADSMKPTAATLRDAVLALLRKPEHITTGLAADEAAGLMGESILSIRPRFTELLALGMIRDSGKVVKNPSGRNATVWVVTIKNEQMRLI